MRQILLILTCARIFLNISFTQDFRRKKNKNQATCFNLSLIESIYDLRSMIFNKTLLSEAMAT